MRTDDERMELRTSLPLYRLLKLNAEIDELIDSHHRWAKRAHQAFLPDSNEVCTGFEGLNGIPSSDWVKCAMKSVF